ncbi:unnamed protein product [Closterium sp. NIES-65]|nr:unnamed protein product [Closterium sp. NIES-65]
MPPEGSTGSHWNLWKTLHASAGYDPRPRSSLFLHPPSHPPPLSPAPIPPPHSLPPCAAPILHSAPISLPSPIPTVGGKVGPLEGCVMVVDLGSAQQGAMGCFSSKAISDPYDVTAAAKATAPKPSAGGARNSEVSVPRMTIADFKAMTNNFNPSSMLGEGSFGRVYRGDLNGRAVAIKKLDAGSQPEDEFLDGVAVASNLRHSGMVELMAFCCDGPQRVLVYELAEHGSLHDILHGRKLAIKTDEAPITLSWQQRMKIALGAATGLAYLHEEANMVHKGVKSSNVLVFDDFTSKIADFNVANEAPDQASRLHSARVLGTFGYNAPEYATVGQLTQKSDVYSFGVVLLELLTGRKPVDQNMPRGQQSLVQWATHGRLAEDRVKHCVDPKLKSAFPAKAVVKFAALAALCVQYEAEFRPSMGTVVKSLLPLTQEGADGDD